MKVITGNVIDTGACIATLASGKKAFVQGALPNETVRIRVISEHSKFVNAVVEEILEANSARCQPRDAGYLATSPWQVFRQDFENECKQQLIVDAFKLSGLQTFSAGETLPKMTFAGEEWNYRNKYTFAFNGEDFGLGITERLSNKVIPQSSFSLPKTAILDEAERVVSELQKAQIPPERLDKLLIRCDANGKALSRVLFQNGAKDCKKLERVWEMPSLLSDNLLGKTFRYGINSFFQINLPIYEQALLTMKEFVNDNADLVDMFSGVGTIGISLATSKQRLTLVDISKENAKFASQNLRAAKLANAKSFQTHADKATDMITHGCTLIVDPPRAGLSKAFCQAILTKQPQRILYLSCNPFTEARDIARLTPAYRLIHLESFNFFPKTPHTESFAVLERARIST